MSHNICENSLAYYGEEPWHHLGTKVDHAMTSEEAIIQAGLDWEIKLGTITVGNFDGNGVGKEIIIPDHFCTVRSDKMIPLGVVGKWYTPVQNKDAFGFFDNVVGEKKAMYHVAGALGKGETVWILAKLPDDIRIKGTDDVINKFLLLTNTHDGSKALRMLFTPVRVVCQNTLNAALSRSDSGKTVVIRHAPNVMARVKQAQEVLGIANSMYTNLNVAFNTLADRKIDQKWLEAYVAAVFPAQDNGEISGILKHTRETVTELFSSPANTIKGIGGTAWAAYNSVTEFTSHHRSVPGVDLDSTRKLKSLWLGSSADINEVALDTALAMV